MSTFFAGFAHLCELIISFSFFENVFSLKSSFKSKKWSYFASFALYLIEFLLYVKLSSTIINISVSLAINSIIAILFFNTNLFSAIASSAFLAAALTASEFISMGVLSIGLKNGINYYKESAFIFALVVIISRLIFFIMSKVSEYAGFYLKGNKTVKMPLFLYLYPLTTIVILYTFWIISTRYNLSRLTSVIITVSSFIVLISVFLTFAFYSRTSKKMDELYKEQAEAERVKIDTSYYSILDKQNETLKTITHDEKNHLLAIKSIANNPEVSAYIDMVYGEIKEYSLFGNTNNKYLDLLLNKYQADCETADIDFDCSIKTANLSFMESTDLISIMSNILDNAIEAARNTKDRKITLSINRNNCFDILVCSNSCEIKPDSTGEDLNTTKTQSGIHGYGFKSIKRTAKKYSGEVEWAFNDSLKLFSITIIFPHHALQ